MNIFTRSTPLVLAALLASSAYAAADVSVQAVQMPAWLQRGKVQFPLRVGTPLQNGDTLITGRHARVLLQGAEGSDIKLGENARLLVSRTAQKQDGKPMFTAALNVLKGAFRFTTATLAKLRPREVSIKVAGSTIGIRGTDVWGKSGGKMSMEAMGKAMGKTLPHPAQEMMDFDVVCLIEGKIDVTHLKPEPFVMDQPVTFYVMPKNEAPMPVSPLAMEQLGKWATETELPAEQGTARLGGKWKVNLLTAKSEADALAAYDTLREAGYDARIQPLAEGQYRLRLIQLASRVDAEALAHELTGKMGVDAPTVGR
jgi:cell division septation protein DedD